MRIEGKKLSDTDIKLIEAYLSLCAEHGVLEVTLQKVAKKAGVAFGTVRYHFSGENLDLAQASILYVVEEGYRFIEASLYEAQLRKDYNGIEAYIRCTFEWVRKKRAHTSFILYYYYLSATGARLVLRNEAFVKRARARITSLLYEAIGRGLYSPQGKPEELARRIHSLLLGAVIVAGTEGAPGAHEAQLEMTLRTANQILGRAG
jgi:AcrR family transcriptional regulator